MAWQTSPPTRPPAAAGVWCFGRGQVAQGNDGAPDSQSGGAQLVSLI
jgi:hypothetical protein